jgi:hypothetical protein
VAQPEGLGVLLVVRSEDGARFGESVGTPDVAHRKHRERHALGVAEHDALAGQEALRRLVVDVERDRDRPQRAVGETHPRQHRIVVGPPEESRAAARSRR